MRKEAGIGLPRVAEIRVPAQRRLHLREVSETVGFLDSRAFMFPGIRSRVSLGHIVSDADS